MRHAAAIIMVFLVIAAMANIAVAWACERFISVRVIDTNLIARERRTEFARDEAGPGNRGHGWVMDAYASTGTEMVRYSDTDRQSILRRSGWPFRSMCCVVEYRPDASSTWTKHVRGGLPIAGFNFLSRDVSGLGLAMGMQGIERVLPLRPLWPGFVLNTMFWASALWLLWMIPRWLRSLWWGIRHKCTRCGYPVGVSPVCTECGRTIKGLVRRGKVRGVATLSS